jgi:hypothetical protein
MCKYLDLIFPTRHGRFESKSFNTKDAMDTKGREFNTFVSIALKTVAFGAPFLVQFFATLPLGVLLLAGCSASSGPEIEPQTPPSIATQPIELSGEAHPEGGDGQLALPLAVELEELVNDGRVLHAAVRLTARAKIPVSEVALRLTGFGAGTKVRELVRSLKESAVGDFSPEREALEPGDVVHAYLALSVTDLSSYGLELLWGEEAKQVLASVLPQRSSVQKASNGASRFSGGSLASATTENGENNGPLVFEAVKFLEPACGRAEGRILEACLNDIKVTAEVANTGAVVVTGAEVGLTLVPMKELKQASASLNPEKLSSGVGQGFQQNEARIQMRPLTLSPGAKRTLRLVVPRSVYDAAWSAVEKSGEVGTFADGFRLQPELRVKSFDAAH